MLLIKGNESVELTSDRIKDLNIDTKNKFTIQEAAMYWAGFAQIGQSDSAVKFDYATILNKLYGAYEKGRLELCYKDKVAGVGESYYGAGGQYAFTDSGVIYNFLYCEIDRDALIKFAQNIGKTPLPLFLSDKRIIDNAQQETVNTGTREENKRKTEKAWQAILVDARDVIAKTPDSYHMNGERYHCSNIAKKLFLDCCESIIGRKEAAVAKELGKRRGELYSERKPQKNIK